MSILHDRAIADRLAQPRLAPLAHGLARQLQATARNTAIHVFLTTALCLVLLASLGPRLGLPEGDGGAARLIWQVLLPASLAMVAAHLWMPQRLARALSYGGVAAIGLGLIALRVLWLRQGAITPAYPLVAFLVVAGLGCGLDYLRALLLIGALAALSVASNWWFRGGSPELVTEAFGTLLLVGAIYAAGHNGQRCLQLALDDGRRQRQLSETDALTGLPNRRGFVRLARIALRQARREAHPLVFAVCDIDCFKAYNDIYGHVEGDRALRRVGRSISRQARRPLDVIARLGGEEFCVLWSDMDADMAPNAAESLRRAVEELQLAHRGSRHGMLTLSIGAISVAGGTAPRLVRLIAAADKLLYAAKREGRNIFVSGAYSPG